MNDITLTARRKDGECVITVWDKPDKKRVLTVYVDVDYCTPRDEHNFGTMFCEHSKYVLGDVQVAGDVKGYASFYDFIADSLSAEDVVLPVYLSDYSGIVLHTSIEHKESDSTKIGFIFVRENKLVSEYGEVNDDVRDRARLILESEVKKYSDYLNAQSHFFDVTKLRESCNAPRWVEVDSCGNWTGSNDELLRSWLGEGYQDYEVNQVLE